MRPARRRHSGHGQREVERGSRAFLAVHPDRSAVALHDLFRDVQPQTQTAVVRRRHLPPAVDVALEDLRSGRSWKGEALPLDDVREQIARLKALLGRYGGVELSVYTSEDQLTLNPYLEFFIYARTDRWYYLLEGKGLEEQRVVRTKSWKERRAQFPAAADLVNAIQAAVERLGLQRA